MNTRFFVRIHPLCVPAACLLCLFNPPRILCCMALGVLIHEAGHVCSALVQKRRLFGLWVDLAGLRLEIEEEGFSYARDLVLHLSGPVASLIFALFSFLLIRLSPHSVFFFSLYFNLFLCLFQLIPLSGSDGANALYALLCLKTDPKRAYRILRSVSRVCGGILLCAFGALLYDTGFHLSLCLFGVSLVVFVLSGFRGREI